MDLEERQKLLSDYEDIFKNEREYYSNKNPTSITEFELEREQFFKKANVKLKQILGDIKGKKVLDVGCGTGSLSFYLAQEGAIVIGIDLSRDLIDYCKAQSKNLGLPIDFREMNAQIPDFEEKSFDIILGSRIIHHLPDINLFFNVCKRLLKKNGFIAFIEPLKKNPIVELNRKFFAPKERTEHEHPLYIRDIVNAGKIFGNLEHHEFFLISPLAMYFSRFINKPFIFTTAYKILNFFEKPLYKIKFLKEYCWQTVFKCKKIE
ncbi:MAG: class I SAM-dependent methyltransferase [Promethearchaeota archaeon]|jgi:2-polyprenyl-3-methyl-5-hydroxy-6-metoxy-1,4-benzoquinol methylase